MNKLEPQTVPPIARSTQRAQKRTNDYWMAAQAKLLKAEKVLQLKEENLEKLLANSYAAIAHGEVSLVEVIPTPPSQPLSEESQREEQVLELVEKVACQMRLFRHQAAIIDLGLVLLTVALLACACLWENTALLLSSCLLLSLLCWSIFLAILGRVMGSMVGLVVLVLAAAIAIDAFCPYLKIDLADYTVVSSYNAIFGISCVNITALSIISVASAALRSTSGVVGLASLWGFLLPIVSFANMLWWDSANGSWYHEHCTHLTAAIVLALVDVIFIWLTISVVWRERVSYRGVNSFLTDQDLKQVLSCTLNHYIEPMALKHAEEKNGQEKDEQEPLPASPEATCKEEQEQEHKPGA